MPKLKFDIIFIFSEFAYIVAAYTAPEKEFKDKLSPLENYIKFMMALGLSIFLYTISKMLIIINL